MCARDTAVQRTPHNHHYSTLAEERYLADAMIMDDMVRLSRIKQYRGKRGTVRAAKAGRR